MTGRAREEPRTVRVADGVRVAGVLHAPEDARAGVVVAHPHPLMGGDMQSPVVVALARALAERGVAALRFDFRHARSRALVDEPDLLRDADADFAAAVENLRSRLPEDAAVGAAAYSFGALVALRNAESARLRAVACVGLPVKGTLGKAVEWGRVAGDGFPPVLVLQGQYDEVGSPDGVRDAVPGADVRTVPNASHGYFGETALVARMATGFLVKRLGA